MSSNLPLPRWIGRWPSKIRRLFGWAAFIVTIFAILPGAFAVLLVFSQPDNCAQLLDGYTSSACTAVTLGIVKIVLGTVLIILAFVWFRFLKRLTDRQERSVNDGQDEVRRTIGDVPLRSGSKDIGMAQVLLSGRLEQANRNSHTVMIDGERVGFLSVYPFRKGWLKCGDFVHVVYQELPLLRRIALAYADAATCTVRGASAWIYSVWVPLLIACIVVFVRIKPNGELMVAFCAVFLVLDLAYLSLMVRARSMLRSNLKSGARDASSTSN
jgi:hypothetical protein